METKAENKVKKDKDPVELNKTFTVEKKTAKKTTRIQNNVRFEGVQIFIDNCNLKRLMKWSRSNFQQVKTNTKYLLRIERQPAAQIRNANTLQRRYIFNYQETPKSHMAGLWPYSGSQVMLGSPAIGELNKKRSREPSPVNRKSP
ncbi:hypothetical protein TNCV_2186681 [Trichonephila clavipes]|nr:hypothetical protein TNCV_2186681 [Trichonephila clavipes]